MFGVLFYLRASLLIKVSCYYSWGSCYHSWPSISTGSPLVDVTGQLYCAILYKGPEHLWILVPTGVLEPIPRGAEGRLYCGSCCFFLALHWFLSFQSPGLQASIHSVSSLHLSHKFPSAKVNQTPFLLLSAKELWHMASLRQLRSWEDIKCRVKKKGSMSITQNFKSDH